MPTDLYCWRCDMVLPMLDEAEWRQMGPALSRAIDDVSRYRQSHGVSLAEAKDVAYGRTALDLYHALTGLRETNADALRHHRASMYGPPCIECGKPLRTPQANFCAACGSTR